MDKTIYESREAYANYDRDFVQMKKRYYYFFSLLNQHKPNDVLEIGCGDGYSLELFKKEYNECNYKGVDISEKALAICKDKGFDVKLGDIEKEIPYEDNSFDFIIAGEVIEHIHEVDKFVSEISRILKPNGILVITTPNLTCWYNRIFMFLGFYPLGIELSYKNKTYGRKLIYKIFNLGNRIVGHKTLFNYSSLKDILNEYNLLVTEKKGFYQEKSKLVNLVNGFFSKYVPLAPGLAFVCKNEKK